MSEYRFFGTESIINGAALKLYGQVVDMDPEQAKKLIAETPPALLLPVDKWDPIGITPAELAEFPSVAIHGTAPDSFRAKAEAVRQAFHDYRAQLLAETAPAAGPIGSVGVTGPAGNPGPSGPTPAPKPLDPETKPVDPVPETKAPETEPEPNPTEEAAAEHEPTQAGA